MALNTNVWAASEPPSSLKLSLVAWVTVTHTRFRFCLFRVTATHKLYLLAGRGGGDQTHRSAGRARLDLAFQTRADVCQRDMGRGGGFSSEVSFAICKSLPNFFLLALVESG